MRRHLVFILSAKEQQWHLKRQPNKHAIERAKRTAPPLENIHTKIHTQIRSVYVGESVESVCRVCVRVCLGRERVRFSRNHRDSREREREERERERKGEGEGE